ncbi:Phospholipase D1 [Yarrowia lipolytica]|nr:Phospholipase D1 [Yarrowia lipolytica]
MLDRVIPLSCVPPYATPYSHVFTTPISNNTNTVFYEDTADSDWQSSDYDSEHATVNVPIRSKRKKNAAKEGNPVDPISEDPHQESFSDGSEAAGPSAPPADGYINTAPNGVYSEEDLPGTRQVLPGPQEVPDVTSTPQMNRHPTADESTPQGSRWSRGREGFGHLGSPSFFRRHSATAEDMTPGGGPRRLFKRPQLNSSNTTSGQRWRDIKAGLRQRFRKKKDAKFSAEKAYNQAILGQLAAGSPAALMVASSMVRDEKNMKRVPILLEQVRFALRDVTKNPHEKNRQYRIDLSYGSGHTMLAWTIYKDYKDFMFLHSRLRTMAFNAKNPFNSSKQPLQIPIFPTRNKVGKKKKGKRDKSNPGDEDYTDTDGESECDPAEQQQNQHTPGGGSSHGPRMVNQFFDKRRKNRNMINERIKGELERYLRQLFKLLLFRGEANKLFQFLELSNMSIRLAPEDHFHGKAGFLVNRTSARKAGWRVSHWRVDDIRQMVARHTSKWFMVRHSYIVCVDNLYSTTPLEVFLLDSKFKVSHNLKKKNKDGVLSGGSNPNTSGESDLEELQKPGSTHITLKVENASRQLKLVATSDKQLAQWMESINLIKERSIWAQQKRFDSFAPVRTNCKAQWFVDARDYFWTLSCALDMAKEVIYIHDWWLSPEIYLRRPPEGNQEWRLDRVLKRKAEQGVKIFVIVYRNVGQTIPIDSQYTKFSLLDLSPNIYVMRSPNQLIQNTYFWAHHEKLCLIDHTCAFVGGIDLCFGRYDTAEHVLVDDAPTFVNADKKDGYTGRTQLFPGKDYSNPRTKDFFSLDKPFEDMYDRQKVPRMPWHDIHMMVVGQPARDLVRHFVQRWNYVLRQKRPSRFTPLLLPPPDFKEEELAEYKLNGTCEVQILRSACSWNTGVKEHEQSIQNAYIKSIEQSEHFVYIENQFFITHTSWHNIVIENKIGDALVNRIIKAHQNDEDWRAIIVIPLMPGFEAEVDESEGSSVRVIMQCQYMSISRGANCIFARLENAGIHPEDYICFFSLRKWGKIGPHDKLVTEQLYIHAKAMVVDDRIAIIGSANINERSQRGTRDSEVAAIVRDTHTVDSVMAGRPYKVGHFAHTLRLHLMREHMGVDVDHVEFIERKAELLEKHKRAEATQDEPQELPIIKNKSTRRARGRGRRSQRGGEDSDGASGSEDERVLDISTSIFGETVQAAKAANGNGNGNGNGADASAAESVPSVMAPTRRYSYQDGVPASPSIDEDCVVEGTTLDNADQQLANLDDAYDSDAEVLLRDYDEDVDQINRGLDIYTFNSLAGVDNKGIREKKLVSSDNRIQGNEKHRADVEGRGLDRGANSKESAEDFRIRIQRHAQFANKLTEHELQQTSETVDDVTELKKRVYYEQMELKQRYHNSHMEAEKAFNNPPQLEDCENEKNGVNGVNGNSGSTDSTAPVNLVSDANGNIHPEHPETSDHSSDSFEDEGFEIPKIPPPVDPYCFKDPLDDDFYYDIWLATAEKNTRLFREVFRCQPDDEVTTWRDYKDFTTYAERFSMSQDTGDLKSSYADEHQAHSPLAVKINGNDKEDEKKQNKHKATHDYDKYYARHQHHRSSSPHYRRSHVPLKTGANFTDRLAHGVDDAAGHLKYALGRANRRGSHHDTVDVDDSPPRDFLPDDFNDPIPVEEVDNTNLNNNQQLNQELYESQVEGENPRFVPSHAIDGQHPRKREKRHIGEVDQPAEKPPINEAYSTGVSGRLGQHQQPHLKQEVDADFKDTSSAAHTPFHHTPNARRRRRRRARQRSGMDKVHDKATAEKILNGIQGHLVMFPTHWLYKELDSGNWFYNLDRIPPIEIYD